MENNATYTLPLASLATGEHHYAYRLGAPFLERYPADEADDADIDAEVDVNVVHGAYRLAISLKGTVTLPCHRCLDPLTLPVDTDYYVTVSYGDRYDDSGLGNEGSADSPDLLVVPDDCRELDLGPILRDTLLSALPLSCTHAAGQCNPQMEHFISDVPAEDDDDLKD